MSSSPFSLLGLTFSFQKDNSTEREKEIPLNNMNCSLGLLPSAKALPCSSSFIPHKPRFHAFTINSKITQELKSQSKKLLSRTDRKPTINSLLPETSCLALQLGALLTLVVEQPALAATKAVINENSWAWAITGVSNEAELPGILIELGAFAFVYLLIMPPIILNWLRLRWFKRKFVEMYFQFMFVFLFFPGILLWAPFINLRPMPVDPRMKYPWTVLPEDEPTDSTSNSG